MVNGAVERVGRGYFRLTMTGFVLSAIASLTAIVLGISSDYFTWEMDRCSCVPEGTPCTVGADYLRANIGWQKFQLTDKDHSVGCPLALLEWKATNGELDNLDKLKSFSGLGEVYSISGVFQRTDNPTQADENNGGAEAGGGVVALQAVCAFLGLFTYKMLKASYVAAGSHCSIGLTLMTKIDMLMGFGLIASLLSFWWLIEGRFGDEDESLSAKLRDLAFDECWSETTDILDCPIRPWTFDGPGWACIAALAGAGLFCLSTLYMLCRAYTVEGILDGSLDNTGAALKPRTVEVEMVVGKALATDGDPDYDSENPLYEGTATMIRPYPLPKSAKAAKQPQEIAGSAPVGSAASSTDGSEFEVKSETQSDPESLGDLPVSGGGVGEVDYRQSQPDLEMIMEGSEEDRASLSQYESDTYSR
ncbi:unnamed protein product, partial [Choristocarpus tenellus]